MAYKEVHRVEIEEVIRRWQAGNSRRSIAAGTGLSRETVRRYLAAALAAGVVQEGPAPTEDQLSVLASVEMLDQQPEQNPRHSKGRPCDPVQHMVVRVDSGRGRNRTLRPLSTFWPPVFAGEHNMGPPKG